MSRIEFFTPASITDGRQKIAASQVINALLLAGISLRTYQVQPWTHLERLIAYDWAMREHLSASDNPVHLRDKPHFVTVAEQEARTP